MILASMMVLKMEEITPYVTDARFQASETVITAHIWIRILQIRRVRAKWVYAASKHSQYVICLKSGCYSMLFGQKIFILYRVLSVNIETTVSSMTVIVFFIFSLLHAIMWTLPVYSTCAFLIPLDVHSSRCMQHLLCDDIMAVWYMLGHFHSTYVLTFFLF